ncbi:MAG: DNA recombination protein RmuC [Firmicutes bacterium]|nr:DNA recombination protein RmuC [Bacillota bacterium]
MTEIQLIYILVALAAVTAVGLLFMIFVNRGLNREVNSMVAAYQNLTRQVDDLKDDNQLMTQTLQGSIKVFGDMISQNQRDSAENMDKRLFELNNRFSHMAVENEQKLENIRNTMEKKISDLIDDNNKQLELMRQTVDEKLQKTLEDRISQSFKLVSERLEQVYKGLGEMQNLAAGVGDLKKVLSNVKTRGILGEVQLGAILEQILSPEQYETDVKTRPGTSERVEFAVKLPGDDDRPVYLPIDAKFPGDAYGKLVDAYEAGDAVLVEEAAKALEKVIKSEAKDIRDKYIEPPYTTEFAIMFLPFEGLYAEVVRRGLLEVLQRDYKVNIAGPTTMAALLNSLQMGFKTLAIQKHSSEVWDVLGAVKTEFDKFGDVLEATQARINQANAELDKLIGTRTRSIQRKLRGVTALGENESAALLDMPDFKDL